MRISIGTILAAGINFGLNLLLVPRYGYIVAGYTTLVGYLCLLVYHFFSCKISRLGNWYDDRFNLLIVAAFLLLLPIINWLYSAPIVRYCVMSAYSVALVTIVYLNRNKLISAWKKIRS